MDQILAKNILPDWIIRQGIRRLNRKRLREEYGNGVEHRQQRFQKLVDMMRSSPLAVNTPDANEQHYELPPRFFQLVLGDHLKYSGCLWTEKNSDLTTAEEAMLRLTFERAELRGAQSILELGCGWGSLTLYMAERLPETPITAVSNSAAQRRFIEARARERGLTNISIITADMNDFRTKQKFDRIVSVEMFEHMRNYETLFERLSEWLRPRGKLFVHIFTNRETAYLFESEGEDDWMGRYFFTGGTMPSNHLLLYFARSFKVEGHWAINGEHYGKTAEAWLRNMDHHSAEIRDIFGKTYGPEQMLRHYSYWRIFFMACAELFKTDGGNEWMVNHYLFSKP